MFFKLPGFSAETIPKTTTPAEIKYRGNPRGFLRLGRSDHGRNTRTEQLWRTSQNSKVSGKLHTIYGRRRAESVHKLLKDSEAAIDMIKRNHLEPETIIRRRNSRIIIFPTIPGNLTKMCKVNVLNKEN